MLVNFESLSNTAKVWVYPASRKFYENEVTEIEGKIKNFMSNWKIEEENFRCSYQFLYNRFIVLVAEGCEILTQEMDRQVGFILSLQNEYELELLDRMNVCFKQGEYVQYKELKEFKKLLKNKSVSDKTIVFDNLIQNKEEFENFWEVPITESWYNRFL